MARPREFDTDTALAKAMNVFWEHGYADASLPDLLTGMELSRGSLYKAFKDKKSLFLKVLNNYDEQAVSDAVTLLTDSTQDGWGRIFALFGSIADTVDAGDRRGCLLCSAIAGPAAYDQEIAAFATKSLDRMRSAFVVALNEALPPAQVAPLADLLVTQYVGMRIMSRTNASVLSLRRNIIALKAIARQP